MVSFRSVLLLASLVAGSRARDVSLFSVFFPEDAVESTSNEKDFKTDTMDSEMMHIRSVMRLGSTESSITKGQGKKRTALGDLPVGQTRDKRMRKLTGVKGYEKKLGRKQILKQRKLNGGNKKIKQRAQVKKGERRFLKTRRDALKSKLPNKERRQKQALPKSKIDQYTSNVVKSRDRALQFSNDPEQRDQMPSFDFIIGGFPKCGTTTLLKAFAEHPETDMAASEQCSIASPGQADLAVLRKLDESLDGLDPNPSVKRCFKCPTAMYNYKSIVRMEKHSPQAKFIVGIRHPIKMLQSFYNYRVTEIYERNLEKLEPIPDFSDLIESGLPWKGVSLASVQFELFLMQLGKTAVTPKDMMELTKQNYELAIKPSNFTVFLYTVDQLEDSDELRSGTLRRDLQKYLGLESPIRPFGHENKNHAVGMAGHEESISICDDQHKRIREQLIYQGVKTANWIRNHFIASPDVIVANKKHFVATLQSWGEDPCNQSIETA